MTCGHSVTSVTEEITKIGDVTGVVVDLPTGAVTRHAEHTIDDAAVRAAVREAGFQLAG